MALSKKHPQLWWLKDDFYCCDCGQECLAEESAIRVPGGKIARWCKCCGNVEINEEDSLGYINCSVPSLRDS